MLGPLWADEPQVEAESPTADVPMLALGDGRQQLSEQCSGGISSATCISSRPVGDQRIYDLFRNLLFKSRYVNEIQNFGGTNR